MKIFCIEMELKLPLVFLFSLNLLLISTQELNLTKSIDSRVTSAHIISDSKQSKILPASIKVLIHSSFASKNKMKNIEEKREENLISKKMPSEKLHNNSNIDSFLHNLSTKYLTIIFPTSSVLRSQFLHPDLKQSNHSDILSYNVTQSLTSTSFERNGNVTEIDKTLLNESSRIKFEESNGNKLDKYSPKVFQKLSFNKNGSDSLTHHKININDFFPSKIEDFKSVLEIPRRTYSSETIKQATFNGNLLVRTKKLDPLQKTIMDEPKKNNISGSSEIQSPPFKNDTFLKLVDEETSLSKNPFLPKGLSKTLLPIITNHPRILSRLEEKLYMLDCAMQNFSRDSTVWRGNETHYLNLPQKVSI